VLVKLETLFREESVQGETREFELIKPEELGDILVKNGYKKISLEVQPSKPRKGQFWAHAFYRKVSKLK